ncbi:hypothetical protein [Actinopolymorpha alba]|uniref:hypothetical protein n=1 Tax=Actinopolymorpha alba TaxID=533267 RepID=UPI0012F662C9|nr:hypothetical protein [Actinopolymorpha alba]
MRILLRYGAAVVLVAALSGCGSGGSGEAGAGSDQMSDAQVLGIGKELAQCIRQNGIPDFPDPSVRDGTLAMPENQPEAALDKAMEACRTIAAKLPQSADSEDISADDIVKLRKWARCLRANGVPEWPDPKGDGSFPIKDTALDGKSERLLRARKECDQYWDKGWWRVS